MMPLTQRIGEEEGSQRRVAERSGRCSGLRRRHASLHELPELRPRRQAVLPALLATGHARGDQRSLGADAVENRLMKGFAFQALALGFGSATRLEILDRRLFPHWSAGRRGG